ncbi:MAG: LPS export ABC transporter periplasmic protein LptC [Pseudomonadales bacterium]|nr:LPS export ABC transporter periplasmic protein LptC [Pseudomonadales bacterium]
MPSADHSYRNRRILWLFTALACGLGALLLFEPLGEPEELPEVPVSVAGEPDLHIEDAVISQYAAGGSMKYRLSARQIRHFDSQRATRLTEPDLILYREPHPPWRITAERGFIRPRQGSTDASEEQVFLRDNVRMQQQTGNGGFLSLGTTSLTVYPDSRYATTDQDVMIDSDLGRTQAGGLNGDLQQGNLELTSDATHRVHTILLPDQFK